ncbi:response regulator [Silvanigrella aquatica]|uniref:Response regulatory domain-containing protein n=1 Tax=Silvanigrella aquatica TaxID=1915309 RepID=A0A1L4CX91_9BACT|nr:response regulator [Silvanigrella aquatica]APJ02573.1 hypothetical protein AXG55_00940 [Silvanigrella aquatica]
MTEENKNINSEKKFEETAPPVKKKILYIDDDEVSQKIISKALSRHFEVISELSGTNAMVLAEKENPNLILLDLNMPNVDGFEILTFFRNHPILSSIPIICVSGDKEENTRRRANELGATKYMPKPIDITQVSNDVKNLLHILNNRIKSSNGNIEIFIAFNSSEKDLEIKKDILNILSQGKNILVISVQDGRSFFKNIEISNDTFELGRLVFLQMKPSLISRLPYLEEFSSVIYDIKKMINFELNSYHLFFDSPEVLFNIDDISQSNSSLHLVSNSLASYFQNISYYTKSNKNPKISLNINSMAKILVGNF